jgi:3-deoxy-D-manno-octulosonic-acid transferase
MYFLYSVLLAVGLVLTLPYWLVQMLRSGKYREGLSERLGRVPSRLQRQTQAVPCIWIHAVSVGEVLAIVALAQALRQKFAGWRIAVSTTTRTGQHLARQKFGEENVFYFPLDLAFAIRPYLRALQPRLVILAETEFWPNFLRVVRESGSRIAVVNARVSDRSFPRYRRWRGLLARVLDNVEIFLAQTELDRERLLAIGAPAQRVQVTGNLKFDIKAPAETELLNRLRNAIPAQAPIIVCGSTIEGEEEAVVQSFRQVLRDHYEAVLILAPRHPERFEAVSKFLVTAGVRFWLRSAWQGDPVAGGVFLLDTIGELAPLYSLARIAMVGGGFAPGGGHNILEPAQFGKPILVGPHTQNFREIISIFQQHQAVVVAPVDRLASKLVHLIGDENSRRELGQRALEVFHANAGATSRTLDALQVLLWMPETMRDRYRGQEVRP